MNDEICTDCSIRADLAQATARADSAVRAQEEVMRENDRLREGLKRLSILSGEWVAYCPACQYFDIPDSQPHKTDCWLNALLNPEGEDSADLTGVPI
jgi:hypothetical protein